MANAGDYQLSGNDSRLSVAEIRARHAEAPSRGRVEQASEYRLTLKVGYETVVGQSLYVMGSIPELGSWTEFACPMTWTDGHVWVTNDLTVRSQAIFQYKYVIKQEQGETIWESGLDRLADLTILANQSKDRHASNVKFVQLQDEWEHFTMKFSVNYNFDDDYYNLRVNGSREELGKWKEGSGPVKMDRCENARWFMPAKFGVKLKPWEVFIRLKNDLSDTNNSIRYNYSVKKDTWNDECWEWEREPARTVKFLRPQMYTGQDGGQHFDVEQDGSEVFIVNGQVEKADGNFLNPFFIQQVGDTNIYVGSYPSSEDDMYQLKHFNIEGVLNFMEGWEMAQHQCEKAELMRLLAQNNIGYSK